MTAIKPLHAERAPLALTNPEAEAMLLGALMHDNALVDIAVEIVTPDDFIDPPHQAVFHAISEAVAAGRSASPVTLFPLFRNDERFNGVGGAGYLAKLTGIYASFVSVRELALQVADLAARRRLKQTLQELAERVSEPDMSVEALVDVGDAALVAAVEKHDTTHQPTGAEAIKEALDRIEAIQRGETGLGAKTGIREFDDLTGGMEAGQVIIIGARPGMGKTAVMCSAAIGCARNGHGTLIFSLEMKSTELGMRIVSDLCCEPRRAIPFDRIVGGTVSHGEMQALARAHAAMSEWPIRIVDKGGLTLSRLSMLARRHKRRMAAEGRELKVIFIDYLQLLRPDKRGQSAYEMVSEISVMLKTLAKELGVAIVALAQLNREAEKRDDKRPQLSDLRDSGQIEQDADIVMFLYREQYYLEKAEPKDESRRADWEASIDRCRNRIDLLMPKRRNGPSGTRWCWYFSGVQAVRGKDWVQAA